MDFLKKTWDAFMYFHTLKVEDFPLACQDEWKLIQLDLAHMGPIMGANGEVIVGSVKNTLDTLPDGKAKELAGRIFQMYIRVLPHNTL